MFIVLRCLVWRWLEKDVIGTVTVEGVLSLADIDVVVLDGMVACHDTSKVSDIVLSSDMKTLAVYD